MQEIEKSIARFAIERCERLLKTESDPMAVARLERLLDRAQREYEDPEPARRQEGEEEYRMRLRAEEYRTIADSCVDAAARRSHLHMARWYDFLAERSEKRGAAGVGPS